MHGAHKARVAAQRPGAQSRGGHGARAGPGAPRGRGQEHRAGAQEPGLSSKWRPLTIPETHIPSLMTHREGTGGVQSPQHPPSLSLFPLERGAGAGLGSLRPACGDRTAMTPGQPPSCCDIRALSIASQASVSFSVKWK